MKKYVILALLALTACQTGIPETSSPEKEVWAIALHGGAGGGKQKFDADGNREPVAMDEARKSEQEELLTLALNIGKEILNNGGSAMDAVEAVVIYLEDCPAFNAGKGAVMTWEGEHELDAAIMDGSNLKAGAIAGVKDIKNPILAARRVMENTPHVMLISEQASVFAESEGLEIVPNSYFTTPGSQRALARAHEQSREGQPMGTVGCVALDQYGNLAAATSTGGMTGKRWGRVGDVPIIGAGTYANNEEVAVSGTGHGELWIRRVVAYDIYALMHYADMTLEEAANEVIWNKIDKMEGSGGGVICVDKNGGVTMSFNTTRMNRAWAKSSGEWGVGVIAGEEKVYGRDKNIDE